MPVRHLLDRPVKVRIEEENGGEQWDSVSDREDGEEATSRTTSSELSGENSDEEALSLILGIRSTSIDIYNTARRQIRVILQRRSFPGRYQLWSSRQSSSFIGAVLPKEKVCRFTK